MCQVKCLFSVKSAYKLVVQIRGRLLNSDASSSDLNIGKEESFRWQKIWQTPKQGLKCLLGEWLMIACRCIEYCKVRG